MSTYINFYTQKRGEQMKMLDSGRFDHTPRIGETVIYNDRERDVVSVALDLSKNSVTVVLSD